MNNNFENSYRRLKKFVENCEKENDEYFIINNYNIEEFEELLNDILKYSDSEYANEILEYINELKLNINDKKMIDKFIPVFAALHC
jgi:CRISPR/Cas system-associated protein Cas7 (RAMP superfamily)